METDLGVAHAKQGSMVELEVVEAVDGGDSAAAYTTALANLRERKPIAKPPSNGNPEQNAKDYYANVRTNVSCIYFIVGTSVCILTRVSPIKVLLAWILSNVCFLVDRTVSFAHFALL